MNWTERKREQIKSREIRWGIKEGNPKCLIYTWGFKRWSARNSRKATLLFILSVTLIMCFHTLPEVTHVIDHDPSVRMAMVVLVKPTLAVLRVWLYVRHAVLTMVDEQHFFKANSKCRHSPPFPFLLSPFFFYGTTRLLEMNCLPNPIYYWLKINLGWYPYLSSFMVLKYIID